MNLLIIGKNSLLCRLFSENTQIKNFHICSRHEIEKIDFTKYTHLINFSFNPALKKTTYKNNNDLDLKISMIAKKYSITYVMISSRNVYSDFSRKLHENIKIYRPISIYGKNKLIIEKNIRRLFPKKHLILRVTTILYNDIRLKRNLFSYRMLNSLKSDNKIVIDFDQFVFKDFIIPKFFARSLDKLILSSSHGTYNICSGLKTSVKNIAQKIIQGYGKGTVIIFNKRKNNESFWMSSKKLFRKTSISLSSNQINNYAINMGKFLRKEKEVRK